MKIILRTVILISLLALAQATGTTVSESTEHIETAKEYAEWMSKGMQQEFKRIGYSKEDLRVEIKVKGALMTITYSGNLLKDKGFRSQIIESHKGEHDETWDAKAYSLGIRHSSIYLEDGTLLASTTISN